MGDGTSSDKPWKEHQRREETARRRKDEADKRVMIDGVLRRMGSIRGGDVACVTCGAPIPEAEVPRDVAPPGPRCVRCRSQAAASAGEAVEAVRGGDGLLILGLGALVLTIGFLLVEHGLGLGDIGMVGSWVGALLGLGALVGGLSARMRSHPRAVIGAVLGGIAILPALFGLLLRLF